MFRLLKRLTLFALLAGGAVVAYSKWKQRQAAAVPAVEPAWPPLKLSTTPDDEPAGVAAPHFTQISEEHSTAGGSERWRTPVDGQCPDGYPVKANQSSGIFHLPGGRSYERTVPARCYATADDAEADGYRQSKVEKKGAP
jgi:hypothetical protein